MEADVSDRSFLEQLHELQHKISFVRAQEFKDARAVYDVMGVLESSKFKAVEKIREWILTKIYMFRKPLSNYQVPQHQLLKYRFFFEFLSANESNIAQEVQVEYFDTISKMFFSYFKAYASRLFKLMMSDAASKEDLLGAEDSVKTSGLTGLFTGKPHHRNRATVFSLGSRQQILTHDFLNPLIVPHAAQESNQKFQFEALFRSIHLAFVDHCSHEFLFLIDFFMVSRQTAVDLHAKVTGRAIAYLIRAFDEKIATNFDCISHQSSVIISHHRPQFQRLCYTVHHKTDNIIINMILILMLLPVAYASYVPNDEDRPLNMKVRCETTASESRDPIGYLVSALAPALYLLLYMILKRFGFAEAGPPPQQAHQSNEASSEPLLTTTYQPPPPPVVAGTAGAGIPLPAPAALPMLTPVGYADAHPSGGCASAYPTGVNIGNPWSFLPSIYKQYSPTVSTNTTQPPYS